MADIDRSSQLNRARRHFLGVAAASGGKLAAMAVLASSVLPGTGAWASRKNQGRGKGGGGSRCFLRGTAVLTANGEVRVEDLRAGDLLRTMDGRTMPVRWIARQSFRRSGARWEPHVLPVRIARHALDDRTPHADLYVSPYHCLYLDGVLIQAKDLVNGTSIAPALPAAHETVDYYHLLLDSHEVVLAEGAPAETFRIEAANHEAFENFAQLERLLPEAATMTMTSFAPVVRFRGRDHLKALLRLSVGAYRRDAIGNAQERLAARARAMAP